MTCSRLGIFYFDLGNVLACFDHERSVANLMKLVDRTSDAVTADRVRHVVFGSGLQAQYETGELSSTQYCQNLREALPGIRHQPDRVLLDACSDIFWLNQGVVPIVAQLAAAGHRLGILSNTCEAHWHWLARSRYRCLQGGLFELSVLSFEVKSMKPDLPIYQVAIERAGLPPEQIFFVDDRAENVQGARAAGMDAVLFQGVLPLVRDLLARGVVANY